MCPTVWSTLVVHELQMGYLTLSHTFVFQVNDDLKFILENDSDEIDKMMMKLSDELSAKVTLRIYSLIN